MRVVFVLIFVSLGLAATAGQEAPRDATLSPSQVTQLEAHLLRVENAKLRAALAQLQAELDTLRLTAERSALVEQWRHDLGAPADAVFDWQARRFTPRQEGAR